MSMLYTCYVIAQNVLNQLLPVTIAYRKYNRSIFHTLIILQSSFELYPCTYRMRKVNSLFNHIERIHSTNEFTVHVLYRFTNCTRVFKVLIYLINDFKQFYTKIYNIQFNIYIIEYDLVYHVITLKKKDQKDTSNINNTCPTVRSSMHPRLVVSAKLIR